MAIYLSALIGLVLWIVLWSINVKGFDAFMLTMLIVLSAAAYSVIEPFLPGNRKEEHPPPGA